MNGIKEFEKRVEETREEWYKKGQKVINAKPKGLWKLA